MVERTKSNGTEVAVIPLENDVSWTLKDTTSSFSTGMFTYTGLCWPYIAIKKIRKTFC